MYVTRLFQSRITILDEKIVKMLRILRENSLNKRHHHDAESALPVENLTRM